MFTYYVGWMTEIENVTHVYCKEVYGLTEARELARKVSYEFGIAQLEGDGIEIELYRNGKLA